jgi:hypothetical protein
MLLHLQAAYLSLVKQPPSSILMWVFPPHVTFVKLSKQEDRINMNWKMEPESLKMHKMGENKGKKIALVVIADVSSGEGENIFFAWEG